MPEDYITDAIDELSVEDAAADNVAANADADNAATIDIPAAADPAAADDSATPSPTTADHAPSLMELIRERASEEDDDPRRTNITLRQIIGGEILTAEVVRRQIWVILLVAAFLVAYIAQGYRYKQCIIEIDKLTTQLKEARYRALSIESELTEKTRESRILEMLKHNHDSLLQRTDKLPYVVEVPDE